jgi:hypothetical protein
MDRKGTPSRSSCRTISAFKDGNSMQLLIEVANIVIHVLHLPGACG